MSGLFSSLNSTVSALSAHSLAIETTGKNLANINNAAYARERVVYHSGATVVTPTGAQSMGLTADVEQTRDTLLDRQVLRETALGSYYSTMQSAYQRAQAGLGETLTSTTATNSSSSSTSATGISASLDDFFNSFQNFAARPTDSGARQALLSSASIMVDRLKQADATLSQLQSDLNTQVGDDVTNANGLLATIAKLNKQIGSVEINSPGSAVDLRDQRQEALEKLSKLMPVTAVEDASGQVQVSSADTSGSPVALVTLATVNGVVAFNGTQITAGSPATTLALSSGSIQGAIDARDGAIQTLRGQLDSLTNQLVTSVNGIYNVGGTGSNFFTPAGTTAGTVSLASGLTATSLIANSGATAGGNDIALAIANLATKKFSTAGGNQIDGSFSTFFSSSVAQFGQAAATTSSSVSNQETIERLVRTQRDSVSGVNLDEETANLIKYQRAFQASSRMVQTIDTLLDTVIRLGQ